MHLTVCSCHVTYAFQSESALYNCLNVKKLLARRNREIWSLSDCNWNQTQNPQFVNEHSTICPNWPNDWAVFWVLICTVHLTVCSCHVTYVFQSESTLYSCKNVKKLLSRSSCAIWNLSDCNWTRTKNHLLRKRTLNHLAQLTKWLSCVLSSFLYGAFDCMFLSCHVRFWEWINTL